MERKFSDEHLHNDEHFLFEKGFNILFFCKIVYNTLGNIFQKGFFMKKKTFLLPALSGLLLAPFVLTEAVSAAEVATTPTSEAVAVTADSSSTTASTAATGTTTSTPTTEASASTSAATPTSETTTSTATEATTVATSEVEAVILHTNDVHGRILEDRGVIGDAKAAAIIADERTKVATTIVVDAGDAFQGMPISNSTQGEDRAAIMNQVGYDAMAVGNHEFDFGLDQAVKYKELLNFPLLSSNTYVDGARLFESYTIVDKDKTVVGDEFVVIGVTTPETATKTHPQNIVGVTFKEPIDEVNLVVDEIEARAAAAGVTYKNYIILAHLGVDTTTPESWRGDTLAKALSTNAKLAGKRVIVIDGHSHTVSSTTYGDNVTYSQTGSYLNNIGKITLKSDQLLAETSLISAADAASVTPDPTIAALVADIKTKYEAENAEVVIANNPVELNGERSNVRVRETNLGNVVTDALYDYGQTGFSNKSSLAVTNGGGLRASIKKDQAVTKGDIIAVLPFGNSISQITVTGQQIKDMFEKSVSAPHQVNKETGEAVLDANGQPLLEASGGFLHVSGAQVFYDVNLEAGNRVQYISIWNPDTESYDDLDLEATYYLATNDFLAAGGDGYTMLGGAREEGPSMDSVFATYLKEVASVNLLNLYEEVNPETRLFSVNSSLDTDGDGFVDFVEEILGFDSNDATSNPDAVVTPPADNSNNQSATDSSGQVSSDTNKDSNKPGTPAVKTPGQAGSKQENQASLPATGSSQTALISMIGLGLAGIGFALKKRKEVE